MGIELEILRELGTVCATQAEKVSFSQTINGHIRPGDFHTSLNKILNDFDKCYRVVTDNLMPLSVFTTEAEFVEGFDAALAAYSECYLMEISKPRTYSEDAYLSYLELQLMKEIKTSYPLLARSYERLHAYIDKWIDNDAWLAMGIDTLFKRLKTLLNELTALKAKDSEDAFYIYRSAFDAIVPFLQQLHQRLQTRALEKPGLEQVG